MNLSGTADKNLEWGICKRFQGNTQPKWRYGHCARHESIWGSGGKAPVISDLATGLKVVSLILRTLLLGN